MKKTKILHLITHAAFGGSQDNTFCTCERHDRERYEVHLACNPNGEWGERARRSADTFHSLPSLVTPIRPWSDLAALLQILRLLRREKFDLVHTHTAKAGFLGRIAAWLCRVPVVIHTYHAFPFHDFLPAWKRSLFLAMERLVQPMTDRFITLSKRQRIDAGRFGMARPADTKAVYTGIDFSQLDKAGDPQTTRQKLGVPEGWQVVVTAARLDPAKAPQLLVEAFGRVIQSHPKTMLLIAGEGELRPQVEACIERLKLHDRVRLLGFRRDVPDLLRAADVFTFSSLSEAMGRAMVEAMLLGRTVVVPAIHGIPEIVRHGHTGFLYEVGRVDQLAEQLCEALANPSARARIGANARSLTRRIFDANHMVEQIEQSYERALLLRNPVGIPVRSPASARHEEEPVPLERAA